MIGDASAGHRRMIKWLLVVAVGFAVPVPSSAQPAGAPAVTRKFYIFFDLNSDEIRPRAAEILAAAANTAARLGNAGEDVVVEVAGNDDASEAGEPGPPISSRRAQAVSAELAKDGVPPKKIVARDFGNGRPLVATPPGTQEPRNRRVEVVLRHPGDETSSSD